MTLPTRIFAETLTDGQTSSGVWNAQRLTTNARAYVPEDEAQKAMLQQMREALLDATAHLVAASSAYGKFAKRHSKFGKAETDAFYGTRSKDFEAAAERAHAAIEAMEATR